MKKIIVIISALVLGAIAGQAESKKNLTYLDDLKINDTTFVKAGKDITLKMDIDLSDLRMNTQHTVALIPVYVSKDGSKSQAFPTVVIDGKTRDKIYLRSQELKTVDAPPMHDETAQVILRNSKKDPQSYEYTATLPYERWMLDGRIELREKIHGCVNCEKGESAVGMFGDPIPTFYPEYVLGKLEPEPEPIKVREESRAARIQFKWDKYDILPNFMNNRAELDTVTNSILLVKNNPDVKITAVYIDGYASPEGTIAHNEILSKNRAYALSEYIHKNVKLDNELLHVSWHGEDWEGFRKLMIEENAYPNLPKRAELIEILTKNEGNSDEVQAQMEALQPREQIYLPLLNQLYPQLRRNEYRIVYDVRNFNLEEAREMILVRPDLLSLKEMYMVAGSYEKGSKEYERTMKIAAENYPNSPAVVNDMALDLIAAKDYKKVVDLLEKSELTKDSPVLLNTLGYAYANIDEPHKAEDAFKKAANGGLEEAKKNLDQVQKVIDQL